MCVVDVGCGRGVNASACVWCSCWLRYSCSLLLFVIVVGVGGCGGVDVVVCVWF